MDKQVLANWEEYATVKQWKRGLKINSHSNRLSEKTLESTRIWMPLFVEYTQKSPDEIIEEALNGKETVRSRLSDFCTWLQQKKIPSNSCQVTTAKINAKEVNSISIQLAGQTATSLIITDLEKKIVEVKDIMRTEQKKLNSVSTSSTISKEERQSAINESL